MAGVRAVVVDSALTLTEALAFGMLLLIFGLVWFTLATARVILGLPASLGSARRRTQRRMIAATHE
jgi:hypothetical protein